MAINKIQLEQDGLVVGNNQLATTGGGVYIGQSLSVANSVFVGNSFINSTSLTANSILVGNVSINSSSIVVSDVTGNVSFINSVSVSIAGNSITPFQGMRNRIINGDMLIWQRGTSFSLPSGGISSANNYTADRWMCYSGGSNPGHTVTRSTDVPSSDFQYSLRNQRNSGNTSTGAVYSTQFIESVNCFDLSNKMCTLSFWAKAGSTYSGTNGQLGVTVGTGTTADQGYSVLSGAGWAGYTTPLNVTPILNRYWTRYTYSFMVGSGTQEMFAMFYNNTTGTAGADDSYYIAGVQLEKGPVATPFEKRHYGIEYLLCQRYYFRHSGNTSTDSFCLGAVWGSVAVYIPYPLRVRMRSAPTVNYSRAGALSFYAGGATSTSSAISGAIATLDSVEIYCVVSGMTTGQAAITRFTANTDWVDFASEL